MMLMLFMRMNAAVDPNFYVYLCLGQSNMEGNAAIEAVDREYVDPRFKTLACVNFDNTTPMRTMGQWYTAYPPIVRPWTNLGIADWFGRTMVAALPSNVTVGVVDVAIGGTAIEGFMSELVVDYLKNQEQWLKDYFAAYDNDPYQRLVDMAKIAQQSGVIKGILLHQGESNNGQPDWCQKVKIVYERLLNDLGLNAANVPLLVGETVGAEYNGACSLHNTVIANIPNVIPTAHVIHSNGCPPGGDRLHFTAASYRIMGKRYAYEALRLMGKETKAQSNYAWNANQKNIYTLKTLDDNGDVYVKIGGSKALRLWGTFADGHQEDLTDEATFSSTDFTVSNGVVMGTEEKMGTVTASYTDFLGMEQSLTINIHVTDIGPNHVLVVNNGTAGTYPWDKQCNTTLKTSMTVGKTYVVKATIKADNGGGCALWPIWTTSPNRNIYGGSDDVQYLDSYNLTPSFQEFTWEFTAAFPIDKLQFVIGKISGKISFDNVSCMEKDTNTEMIVNGDFENDDLSKWEVLGYNGQSMIIGEDNTTGIRTVCVVRDDDGVYTLQGIKVGISAEWDQLPHGIYVVKGRLILK
jgi:hypothetical protein